MDNDLLTDSPKAGRPKGGRRTDPEAIREAIERGESFRTIGRRLGVSHVSIKRTADRLGIVGRRMWLRRASLTTIDPPAQVAELIEQAMEAWPDPLRHTKDA